MIGEEQLSPFIVECLPIIGLAFSVAVRKMIGKRDSWTCQEDGCGKSYQTGWMVEATHNNHNKSEPSYDTVEAGKIRCIYHHLQQHENAQGHAQDIGLCENANNYAIRQLKKKDEHTIWWRKK